jgi:hypothetical protein
MSSDDMELRHGATYDRPVALFVPQLGIQQTAGEVLMRKLGMILTAAALALGTMALTANAQTAHPGAAVLNGQLHNFTPIIEKAACNGTTGAYGCGPGYVWNGRRCVHC